MEWQFKFSNRLSKLAEGLVFPLWACVAEGQQVSVELCRRQGGAGQVAGQAAGWGRAGPQPRPGQGVGLGAPSFQGQLRLLGWAAGKQSGTKHGKGAAAHTGDAEAGKGKPWASTFLSP